MQKSILTILLFLLSLSMGWAQVDNDSTKQKRTKTLALFMEVEDHLTHQGLDSIWGGLYNAVDSSFVDTLKFYKYEWGDRKESGIQAIVDKPGNYYIELNAEGYQSKRVSVELPKLYKRESYRTLKKCYLKSIPKPRELDLDEVVIKATKLKFYMDGDTLVYNADAFSMAEGSMLGELVRKLPGVELKKGGEITVNGKKVESLLLNGKDFFDSDRELLLENMPTYMVSKIQTYERVPIDVKGTKKEKTTPKETVMNVKLKRDYNSGWLANAEAGASPVDIYSERDQNTSFENSNTKYLGRLFALRFDDISRLNLYANVNNLSDNHTPGEGGDWSPASQARDISKVYTAGGSYAYGDYEKLRYNGSAKISFTDQQAAQHSSSQTFLDGGDTYGRSFSKSKNRSLNINTNQSLHHNYDNLSWAKSFNWDAQVSFNYNKWDNSGESADATFSKDISTEIGKEWIDSIKAPNAGDVMRQYAINRILSQNIGKGHSTLFSGSAYSNFSPAHNDMMSFTVNMQYDFSDRTDDGFEHYLLEYPTGGGETDFRNKYSPTFSRSHSFNISPSAQIDFDEESKNGINVSARYYYSYDQSNNSLYLLNHLQGWDDKDKNALGILPSEAELLATLDADNSTRSTENLHRFEPSINYMHSINNDECFNIIMFGFELPTTYQHLDYWQGSQVDTTMTRRTAFLNPNIRFFRQNWQKGQYVQCFYEYSSSAPSMTSLIDIHNTSDPLNIHLSNPNLKNSHTHQFFASYSDKYGRVLFNASANANFSQNSVAYGYILDRKTGVKTITPENVNGNWTMNSDAGIDFPLTKDEKWRMKESVGYNYNHSVDLYGVDGAEKATRSVVGSHYYKNEWRLSWQPTVKMEFTAKTNLNYQHSTGDRVGFQTINAFNFNYGATAKMELPWNMQFSTDATMYSRRGYDDKDMNTNEFVWNARLTKRFMHGNLLLQLDALDMLGQLSNVSRSINAQGKSETFYNVMPSYILARIVWRLNKKPKKEKGNGIGVMESLSLK